jgi:putative transposase
VRYIVDHYNQSLDARMGDQSRIGRWEAGRIAQLALWGERELDICLMRRDRRTVYRSGYIQFANLTYQGEHLAAYAGEFVILRYNPRDITTIYLYQQQDAKEVFLTRAHAQGWETETLSYAEAQALSRRRREAGNAISNRSLLEEVRDRETTVKKLRRRQQKASVLEGTHPATAVLLPSCPPSEPSKEPPMELPLIEAETEGNKPRKPVPYVRVYDYEDLKREGGLL